MTKKKKESSMKRITNSQLKGQMSNSLHYTPKILSWIKDFFYGLSLNWLSERHRKHLSSSASNNILVKAEKVKYVSFNATQLYLESSSWLWTISLEQWVLYVFVLTNSIDNLFTCVTAFNVYLNVLFLPISHSKISC